MQCPSSPKCVAKLLFRISFGASLALVGIAHYMDVAVFAGMVAQDLGPLAGLGSFWGYVLPALQIVGGALIAANYRTDIGVWAAGVALVSIAVGMLLKSVFGAADLGQVMPAVNNTLLWLLVYLMVVKCCLCGSGAEGGAAGGHCGHACGSC